MINLDVYNSAIETARFYPDKSHGNSEDSIQDLMVQELSSPKDITRDKFYFLRCVKNINVGDIRRGVWLSGIHETYNFNRLSYIAKDADPKNKYVVRWNSDRQQEETFPLIDFGSSDNEPRSELELKKLYLILPHLKPHHRTHIYYKFFTNVDRKDIVKETSINDIRQHDDFIKKAFRSIKEYWEAFKYFSVEEINTRDSLTFFTPAELRKKWKMGDRTLTQKIHSGELPHIMVDRKFYIESAWADKFNDTRQS